MLAILTPHNLSGQVAAPSSKSQAHRLLICAALADTQTEILCPARSADIDATADCLRALGAEIQYKESSFWVTPIRASRPGGVLPCRESGSTLRFLLPVAAALGADCTFRLAGRLPERPLSPLWEELCRHGVALARPQPDTIRLTGRLAGSQFTMAANISSQFITGLLFALPLLGGGRIDLTGQLESVGYLEMTCQALACFGVETRWEENAITVAPGGYRSPGRLQVEGDWSGGAFWLCANALGAKIDCTGLDPASKQGDRRVNDALAAIRKGNATIPGRDIPDLIPALAVVAAGTPGTTRFTDIGRLRLKESDRIATTLALIEALGGSGAAGPDSLEIYGKNCLPGGVCDSCGDHRIAMSAAIASLRCTGPVTLRGAQAVEKSYPAFWQAFASLGGQIAWEEEA